MRPVSHRYHEITDPVSKNAPTVIAPRVHNDSLIMTPPATVSSRATNPARTARYRYTTGDSELADE